MSAINNNITSTILDLPPSIYTDELPNYLSALDIFNFFSTCKTLWNNRGKETFWRAIADILGLQNRGLSNNRDWARKTMRWLQFQFSEVETEMRSNIDTLFDPGHKEFKALFQLGTDFFGRAKIAPLDSPERILYLQQHYLYRYFVLDRQNSSLQSHPMTALLSHISKEGFISAAELKHFNLYIEAKNACRVWSKLASTCSKKLPVRVERALKGSAQDVISVAPKLTQWVEKHVGKLMSIPKIELSYLDLKFLPLSLFKLTNLQSLTLTHNQLYKLPEDISNLTQLTELDLTGNQFCDFPKEILKIKTLTSLNMDFNPLKNIPLGFDTLLALKTFSVYGHRIKFLPKGFTWPVSLKNPPKIPIETKLSAFFRNKITTLFH